MANRYAFSWYNHTNSQNLPKDAWDKLSIMSGFLASVAVPVVIAVVGNWYTTAIKDRETAISERDQKIRELTFEREWAQLGLSILRDPDTAPNIRTWGVKIVSEYAKVPMEEETREAFAAGAVLPEAAAVVPLSSPAEQTGFGADVQTRVVASATSRTNAISELQTQGVRALLDKDLSAAISAYDQAYQLWPTFRNVDEIRRALLQSDKLDGPDWPQLYRQIASMDLRGVSEDVRAQVTAAAGSE